MLRAQRAANRTKLSWRWMPESFEASIDTGPPDGKQASRNLRDPVEAVNLRKRYALVTGDLDSLQESKTIYSFGNDSPSLTATSDAQYGTDSGVNRTELSEKYTLNPLIETILGCT